MEDKIKKIHVLLYEFRRQHNLEANVVMLGNVDYYDILKSNHMMVNKDFEDNIEHTIFGLKIARVNKESYLSVAYEIMH